MSEAVNPIAKQSVMSDVAEMARMYGLASQCEGKAVEDLAEDVPIVIARAGTDQFAGLNERGSFRGQSGCVREPSDRSAAFELFDDSETSRAMVRQVLAFFTESV